MSWFTLCRLYWSPGDNLKQKVLFALPHNAEVIHQVRGSPIWKHINCKPATWNSISEWTILLLISEGIADINLLTFWTQEGQRLRVCPERLLCGEQTDNMFISERKWSTAESRKSTTGVGHWLQKNLRRSTVRETQKVAFRLTYWRVKTNKEFEKNTKAQVLCT